MNCFICRGNVRELFRKVTCLAWLSKRVWWGFCLAVPQIAPTSQFYVYMVLNAQSSHLDQTQGTCQQLVECNTRFSQLFSHKNNDACCEYCNIWLRYRRRSIHNTSEVHHSQSLRNVLHYLLHFDPPSKSCWYELELSLVRISVASFVRNIPSQLGENYFFNINVKTIRLRIGIIGKPLCVRHWTSGFHKPRS